MFSVLLLAVLLQTPSNQPHFSTYMHLNGECWVLRVTASDLATVPVWRESDDAPPLPPRAAIAASRVVLRELVKDGDEWELERISLRQIGLGSDVSIYEVKFLSPLPPLPPNTVGSVGRSPLSLIVLMDGRAITPTKGVNAGNDCRIDSEWRTRIPQVPPPPPPPLRPRKK